MDFQRCDSGPSLAAEWVRPKHSEIRPQTAAVNSAALFLREMGEMVPQLRAMGKKEGLTRPFGVSVIVARQQAPSQHRLGFTSISTGTHQAPESTGLLYPHTVTSELPCLFLSLQIGKVEFHNTAGRNEG